MHLATVVNIFKATTVSVFISLYGMFMPAIAGLNSEPQAKQKANEEDMVKLEKLMEKFEIAAERRTRKDSKPADRFELEKIAFEVFNAKGTVAANPFYHDRIGHDITLLWSNDTLTLYTLLTADRDIVRFAKPEPLILNEGLSELCEKRP